MKFIKLLEDALDRVRLAILRRKPEQTTHQALGKDVVAALAEADRAVAALRAAALYLTPFSNN